MKPSAAIVVLLIVCATRPAVTAAASLPDPVGPDPVGPDPVGLDAAARRCLSETLAGLPESAVPLGERDAFAVMDPYTGRILWHRHPQTLAQRAFLPGSLFKVVTTYAALNRRAVELDSVVRCQGGKERVGEVECWYRPGHGPVNLSKALAFSCNLYFARLGMRVGPDQLLQVAREFCLGESTGSDLPGEIAGRLPDSAAGQEITRLAVGQSAELQVTPLQILSLIGAVVNGGALYSPRLSEPDTGRIEPRGILSDPAALRFVRAALEEASAFGTGARQNLGGLQLAGKTGTATGNVPWRTHAWYMGFAPLREPLVALVAFVYQGQGSQEGAALARAVMLELQKAMRSCRVESTRP